MPRALTGSNLVNERNFVLSMTMRRGDFDLFAISLICIRFLITTGFFVSKLYLINGGQPLTIIILLQLQTHSTNPHFQSNEHLYEIQYQQHYPLFVYMT